MSKLTKRANRYGRTDPSYRKVFAMTNIYIFYELDLLLQIELLIVHFLELTFLY